MKKIVLFGLMWFSTFLLQAQNQIINGDLGIGHDAGTEVGAGHSLTFGGVLSNSDLLSIYRFNRAFNLSDLRVSIGDDYGGAGDRFVVGSHNWTDKKFYSHMVVDADGKIGIGTEVMGAERLAVNGLIRAKEIKVEGGIWPDYVFEEGYTRLSLASLQHYINQNKHLPGFPTAKTVERNGVELGEMSRLFTEKIEELTLHLIEKDTEIKGLKKRLDQMEILLNKYQKK